MLACARIGATAQRGLRRVLRRRAGRPDPGRRRQARDHRRRRVPARQAVGAQADGRRGRRAVPERSSTCWWSGAPAQEVAWARERTSGGTTTVEQASAEHSRAGRSTPSTRCSSSTRPARPAKPKGILHTTGGYLTQVVVHPLRGLRPQARHRRLLVHRRHRLGHRPQLHRVRPAVQRRDPGHVRGHAGHPAPGPVLGARREVQGDDPLHRADADPHVDEVGRRHPGPVRPVVAAAARLASASRSTRRPGCGTGRHIGGDRCPVVDTWWQTETGAIMISPLPGRDRHQAGLGDAAAARHHRRRGRRHRPSRCRNGGGGYLVLREPWPTHAAHDLGRRPAVHRHVLVAVRRACTSPATAPSATRTATCGCSAGSTT